MSSWFWSALGYEKKTDESNEDLTPRHLRQQRFQSHKKGDRFLVVAMDGGGVRGVLTCVLWQRLCQRVPELKEKVMLYAGTSTGAILATALAANKEPEEIIEVYKTMSAKVFSEDIAERVEDGDGMFLASYRNGVAPLKQTLQQTFADKTLHSLSAGVVVTTFDLGGLNDREASGSGSGSGADVGAGAGAGAGATLPWRPLYLHNLDPDEPLGDLTIVDTVMRSTAAPTYFPSYQGCIDGGVVANNPAVVALTHALSHCHAPLEDIAVLSLGTGYFPQSAPAGAHNWGVTQWMRPLLGLLFDGVATASTQHCASMLGDRFARVDPLLDHAIALDDCNALEHLVDTANKYDIDDTVHWLRTQLSVPSPATTSKSDHE